MADGTTVPAGKGSNKSVKKGARKSQSVRGKKSVAAVAGGGGAARKKTSAAATTITTQAKGKARPTAAEKRKTAAAAATALAKAVKSDAKAPSRKRSRAPSKKKLSAAAVATAADSANGASSSAGAAATTTSKRKKAGGSAGSPIPRALKEWEDQAAAVGARPLGELLQMCASVFQIAATPPTSSTSSSTQTTQITQTERPPLDWSALAKSNNKNGKNNNKGSWNVDAVRRSWHIVNQGRMPLPVKEASLGLLWDKLDSERMPSAQGPVVEWFANTAANVDGWQSTQQQLAENIKNAKAMTAATAAREHAEAAASLERASNARFAAAMATGNTSIVDNNNNNSVGDKRSLASTVSGVGGSSTNLQNKRTRLEDTVRPAPQQQQQQQQQQHAFAAYPGAVGASATGVGAGGVQAPVDSIALAQATPGFALWAHVERQQYIEMVLTRIRVVTEQRIAVDPSCLARAQTEAESQARAVQLGLLSEFFSLPQMQQAEYAKQFAVMTAGATAATAAATESAALASEEHHTDVLPAIAQNSSTDGATVDAGSNSVAANVEKEESSSTTASTDVVTTAEPQEAQRGEDVVKTVALEAVNSNNNNNNNIQKKTLLEKDVIVSAPVTSTSTTTTSSTTTTAVW